jgi:hypothetical protein
VDKETLHKEIDLIQDVIKRLASNSFLIKGWYITVTSASMLISRSNLKDHFAISLWVVLIAPILFWLLDAYFLAQELLFRKLYQWVIRERLKGNQTFLYDLNAAKRFGGRFMATVKAAFSPTLLIFYALPVTIMAVIFYKAR